MLKLVFTKALFNGIGTQGKSFHLHPKAKEPARIKESHSSFHVYFAWYLQRPEVGRVMRNLLSIEDKV